MNHRCESIAQVRDFPKRCIKALDHIGSHAWLEDSRVVSRQPIRAEWVDGDHRATEITSTDPTASADRAASDGAR